MQTKLEPHNNQHALVLLTLINPPKELCFRYWMRKHGSGKWSSRLGEVEKKLGVALVNRDEWGTLILPSGKKKDYVIYKPILSKDQYIEFYNQINKTKRND